MILVSTGLINFGKKTVGENSSKSFTIFNDSNYPVDITIVSSQASFTTTPTSASMNANSSKVISVKFEPDSETVFSETLTISHNDPVDPGDKEVTVEGEGIRPIIEVSETALDFENVSVDDLKSLTFVIQNTSQSAKLIVSNISSDNTNFTVSPTSFILLPATTDGRLITIYEKTITVTFNPTSESIETGKVTISNNSSNNDEAEVDVQGEGKIPIIYVDKTSINYGNITINDSKTEIVTVTNNSVDEINLLLTSITTNNARFSKNISSAILAKDESIEIEVTFYPLDTALQTGKLIIENNSELKEVDLEGEGTATPNIRLATETVNFGKTGSQTTTEKTLRISNVGLLDLNISLIESDNPLFTFVPSTLIISPSASATLTISYSPLIPAQDTGILTITSNDPDLPEATVNLEGECVSPVVETPEEIDFKFVTINGTKTESLRILNSGEADLIISNITIPDSNFSVEDLTYPLEIARGRSQSVDVTFSPIVSGRLENIILTIYSNDYVNPNKEVTLKGQSVDANIKITPDNAQLDFGIVTITETKPLSFNIKNLGQGDLDITDIIISTSIETVISIDKTTSTILPNQSDNFIVTFEPLALLSYQGTLTVKSNASDMIIDIKGEGKYSQITVNRLPIIFDSIVPDDSTFKTLTVSNTSDAELQVDLSVSIPFSVDSSSFRLDARESKELKITFSPTSVGLFNSPLEFTTNVTPPDDSFSIDLEGTALDEASLIVTPASIDFGEVKKSEEKTKNVKLENVGTKSLTFTTSRSNPDLFTISPLAGNIAAGGNMLLQVIFAPPRDVLGDITATTISENLAINSPESIVEDHNVALIGSIANTDLEWTSTNLSENEFYASIKVFITAIQEVLPPVISALEIVNAILNVVKALIVGKTDLLRVIIEELIAQVEVLLDDLAGTGLYSLFLLPDDYVIYKETIHSLQGVLDEDGNPVEPKGFQIFHDYFDVVKFGSQAFKNKIINSFDDLADSRRPQFSDSAYAGGLILAVDSEDPMEIIESMIKLGQFFKKTFKANFYPPTNVTALSGSNKIRLTFSPNSEGFLSSDYLIFRSEVAGGSKVNYDGEPIVEGKKEGTGKDRKLVEARRDLDGNILKSYKYIGRTNTPDQIRNKKKNMTEEESKKIFSKARFRLNALMTALGDEDGTMKFIYDDYETGATDKNGNKVIEGIDRNKSYYYVIMSAELVGRDNKEEIGDLQYYSQLVKWRREDNSLQPEDKKSPKDTNIRIFGDLSNEAVGTLNNSFLADSSGLARCRNYRCTNTIEAPTKIYTINENNRSKVTLLGFIKESTLSIKAERQIGDGKKRKFDIVQSDYTIQQDTITFTKSQFFKIGDKIIIDYEYYEEPKSVAETEKHKLNLEEETHTIYLRKHPVVEPLTIRFTPSTYIGKVELVNAETGEVSITTTILTQPIEYNVEYNYYDLEGSTNYRCTDSVFNEYYFDKITCHDGTTQCDGYENANCIYNDGLSCSNTGTSTRKISTYIEKIKNSEYKAISGEEYEITKLGKQTINLRNTPVYEGSVVIFPEDAVLPEYKLLNAQDGTVELTAVYTGILEIHYGYDEETITDKADPNLENQKIVPEDIPFEKFWDVAACQNGTMSQRCDGYSKVFAPGELTGLYPNWNAIRIGDILPVEELIGLIEKLLKSLLAGTEKLSNAVVKFIELIQKKIEYIQNVLIRLQEMIDLLDTIFFDADLHLLSIPTSKGGNEYLKDSIANAEGGPSSSIDGFTGGVVVTWGAPNFGDPAVKTGEALMKLLGKEALMKLLGK